MLKTLVTIMPTAPTSRQRGQPQVAEQDEPQGDQEEDQRRHGLVGPQLLLRIVGRHDDEVAVLLEARQGIPPGVGDDRVPGLERDIADVVLVPRQGLAPPVDREVGNAVDLPNPEFAAGLADET